MSLLGCYENKWVKDLLKSRDLWRRYYELRDCPCKERDEIHQELLELGEL